MDESMRGADVDEERKKAVKGKQGAQPKLVLAVPRLLKDVRALAAMFEGDERAVRLVSQLGRLGSVLVMPVELVLVALGWWMVPSSIDMGRGALKWSRAHQICES